MSDFISSFFKSKPHGFAKAAFVVFATFLVTFTSYALWPTANGKVLLQEASKVRERMEPLMKSNGIPFKMVATRTSLIDSLGQDLSSEWFTPEDEKVRAFMKSLSGSQTLQTVAADVLGTCTVYASAEIVDAPNRPMAVLSQALNSVSSAWQLMLLHESAHCLRNFANEQRKQTKSQSAVEVVTTDLFSLYMTEAYADVYAVLSQANMQKLSTEEFFKNARTLILWRASMPANPTYRTESAIAYAMDKAQAWGKDPIQWTSDQIHDLAKESAWQGRGAWQLATNTTDQQLSATFVRSIFKDPKP